MLFGLALLLLCQLAGEALSAALRLPVPGPVLGLVLLLMLLLWRGRVPDGLRAVTETLLRYLALLFVPAGVGLMAHWHLVRADWPIMLAVLVLSTVLTITVTALTLRWLLQREARRRA